MENIFKPTYLRELCKQYNLVPSKKYGQNFLIQEHPIKKMIEAAGILKTDTVIEIGPGFGILTFALAEKAGKVVAFEIEKKLTDYWTEQIEIRKLSRFTSSKSRILDSNELESGGNLEIIFANALYSLKSYTLNLKSSYKVVANLPYQITSNVIRILLELENKPESITIMVQKEVAERICARPPQMSLLAISVQYYGEPKIVSNVTRGNFWPEPGVDSAILYIKLNTSPLPPPYKGGGKNNLPSPPFKKGGIQSTTVPPFVKGGRGDFNDEQFFRVVKIGFAQKRKQLWNNLAKGLKVDGNKVKKALLEVCGNEKVRAEELSVNNWASLIHLLL